MPHEFTRTSEDELEGVWFKNNGRRYCAWRYHSDSQTLQASRGVVVRTASLEAQTRCIDELRARLPQLALELAQEKRH